MTTAYAPPTDTSTPSPAPVIPATDPSTGSTDAVLAEAQARQITSASLSSYGSLPNPQLAFEAITTGATPTISSMIMAGDPRFQSELAGAPAGASALQSPYPQVPATINDPSKSLWDFDPTKDQQTQKQALQSDQGASWRSFGMTPEMNFGWMNSVRNGAPTATKKWQQLFKDKGFYSGQNYQVSGVWDKSTETAFQSFMTQWATPYALFSQDSTTKSNATMFLNGLGMDVATLETTIGRDPSTLAQIAQGWMAAQGPDVGASDQKAELQQYSDTFGLSALPESYQAVLHTDFLSNIRDTLASIPLLGSIPLVGGIVHGAENLITGNLDLGHLTEDPRQARADQIRAMVKQEDVTSAKLQGMDPTALAKLTSTDLANLDPALAAVQDDAGFLGFMSSYDNARTTGILTIWDMLKEGLTKGKWENPFDPMSTPRIEAAAAHNNLAAGLFGDSWAKDNPVWATMFNAATNMLDDPTMYIPLMGESELYYRTLGKYNATHTAAKLIGDTDTQAAFHDVMASKARMQVNQGLFNTARTAYAQGSIHDGHLAQMFAINGTGGARDVQKLALARKVMTEKDSGDAWRMFQSGDEKTDPTGFGYLINSGRGVFNAAANFRAVAQTKSANRLMRMRVVGGMNTESRWDALADPAGTSTFLGNMAEIAGMSPKESGPVINAYTEAALSNPDKAVETAQAALDAVHQAYERKNGVKLSDLDKWKGEGIDHVVAYAPEAYTGEEQSWVLTNTAGMTDSEVRRRQGLLNDSQQRLRLAHATGATDTDLQMIRDEITNIARPAPGLTTQMGNEFVAPYSPFELVAFANPAMRKSVKFQRQVGIDAAMNAWRRITIGRISTAMRIDVGDDMIRPFAFLIGHNQWGSAFQYLTSSILKMGGLLVPGARAKILNDLDGFLEEHPETSRMLQDVQKARQETSTNSHETIEPGKPGYVKALGDDIRYHWSQDSMAQAWLQAEAKQAGTGRQGVYDLYKRVIKAKPADLSPEEAKVRAHVRARNMHLSDDYTQFGADQFDAMMQGYMANPTIRRMSTTGKVNQKELAKLVRDQANTPHRLPLIFARQDNPYTRNTLMHLVNKMPNAVFENVTGPMVNTARAGGFMKMKGFYEQQMRKYFNGQPRYGTPEFEREIEQESTSRAVDWVMNNTYQGTRSVAGATVRNVLPFYGATSNMDRFYLRQAMTSPYVGSLVLHAGESSQQSQNAANNTTSGITGLQGVLAHLGFGAGEGLQFNPLHAFFLTSDGIGSMVPGTGPLFAPLWNVVSQTPGLATILADIIPGAQQQIDYNTGQAKPPFTYLADALAGTSLALTGQDWAAQIPFVGAELSPSQDSINAQVDAKAQEWERNKQGSGNNGTVTPADLDAIRREVGRDLMLEGAAQFTLPVDPKVVNAQQQQSATNLDAWRQQTSDVGRDAVILQNLPGVTEQQWQAALTNTAGAPTVADLINKQPDSDAALMAYEDHRVSQSDRDAIANASPWVVSTSKSKYQSANLGPGMADRPFDLPQWQLMRNLGDITVLSPDAYLGTIANERDINTGWLEYDGLKNQEYAAMVQNGWTTASPQYTAWNQAVFQPQLINIQKDHPAFWQQFGSGGGGTTAADLAGKTRALRTLQTWEVLPQHSDFESQQSVLWRNALQLRDNAAGQIYQLKASGGSTAEQQLVMQSFQEQLQALAATDPAFAAQLGGFRFSNWEDVVTLMADEMQANALSGYPAGVGTQGQS